MFRFVLLLTLVGCASEFGLTDGTGGARGASDDTGDWADRDFGGDGDEDATSYGAPNDDGWTGIDAPDPGEGPDPGDGTDGPGGEFGPGGGDPYFPDTGWNPGDDEDLCRTRGFWLNHPYSWPVATVTLGNETLSIADGIDLLELSTEGDASLTLAVQLLATKLNLELGAGPNGILAVVDDADDWLAAHDNGALPYGVPSASAAGAEALDLADALDDFNNQTCW